jgi:hypothetical protein
VSSEEKKGSEHGFGNRQIGKFFQVFLGCKNSIHFLTSKLFIVLPEVLKKCSGLYDICSSFARNSKLSVPSVKNLGVYFSFGPKN